MLLLFFTSHPPFFYGGLGPSNPPGCPSKVAIDHFLCFTQCNYLLYLSFTYSCTVQINIYKLNSVGNPLKHSPPHPPVVFTPCSLKIRLISTNLVFCPNFDTHLFKKMKNNYWDRERIDGSPCPGRAEGGGPPSARKNLEFVEKSRFLCNFFFGKIHNWKSYIYIRFLFKHDYSPYLELYFVFRCFPSKFVNKRDIYI